MKKLSYTKCNEKIIYFNRNSKICLTRCVFLVEFVIVNEFYVNKNKTKSAGNYGENKYFWKIKMKMN